jgi:transcriptional regulator with XRE-family HTH domain
MKNTVNKRIKELRQHLSMTQQDFAALCGLTNTSLSRIENEEVEPQNGTVQKVINNTGVNSEWLIKGIGELSVKTPEKELQPVNDLYKDALYVELKQNAQTWQEKYNDLWITFTKVLDRSKLGELKALEYAAIQNECIASNVFAN